MNDKVLPKPVDWDELYPGRFIKAGDFKGKKPTLTIAEVNIEELIGDKGAQIKGVIKFNETEKHWALNKTNGICLKAMFGRQVQEWVGKRVTLFADTWNGEICIRVYGSPDISEDAVVPVALPRRRPFNMTMHKVTKGGAKSTNGNGQAARAEKELRAAEDPDALEAAMEAARALFGDDIPIAVEAAYKEMAEHFAN